ncbi:MAG: efflux RND transporter periplasmic adaptor subunit [Desulfocapsa sp.]|nr:efflux RND transporter periplasmic adaptor subunit [Desulfocapsa sp.]
MNDMDNVSRPPQTARAKVVYFLWNNIPRFILFAMIGLILFLIGVIKNESNRLTAEKASAVSMEKPAVNVISLTLVPTTIHDRINLSGSIEPWTRLELLAKIRGTVTEVLCREGDRVREGDTIARIEDDDYRIALERAAAVYNLEKAEYDREQSLHTKGMVPIAALDSRKTRMQTAKADMENARLQLSRCTITAPMNGVIRTLYAKKGLLLSVADPVAEILEINRLKAVIGIPESDRNAVRRVERVALTIQALDNKEIIAEKHYLSPSPETYARIYKLELAIDNSDGNIFPGMFVRADIVKKRVKNGISIPFYSVISRNDEQFVFVERDGIAEKRNVSLGIMEKWLVEITEGLQPGDRLIIEGHRDIEDGLKVNVVKNITDPEELTL